MLKFSGGRQDACATKHSEIFYHTSIVFVLYLDLKSRLSWISRGRNLHLILIHIGFPA